MNNITRKFAIAAAALATVGTLTACSTGSTPSWESEVRASVQSDWNASTAIENSEGCQALQMFGLTDPEALTDFIMPMAGEMTPEDYADMGIPLGSDALNGVDTEEIIMVAADEMIALCDF